MTFSAATFNNRQYPRRPISSSARLYTKEMGVVGVRLLDISEGGLSAISQLNMPVGSRCLLTASLLLTPAKPELLRVEVEVRDNVYSYKAGGFRISFMFIQITPAVTQSIRDFVSGKNQTKMVRHTDTRLYA